MEIVPFSEENVFVLSELMKYDVAERKGTAVPMRKLMKAIRDGVIRFVFLKEGETAVGFAGFSALFDYAVFSNVLEIGYLYLLPQMRGKGYGKKVIRYLEKLARASDAEYLLYRGNAVLRAAQFRFTKRADGSFVRKVVKEEEL